MIPLVSVILPTFNRVESLEDSCRSVLNQSFSNLELIVIDDGSTEDIEAQLDIINDSRIVYFRREKNAGASAARNTGLSIARGQYIAFQDSDDIWLPGKLRKQLSLLEELPQAVGAVTGGKVLYGCDEKRNRGRGKVTYAPDPTKPLTLEEDQIVRFLLENRISLQNTLFRRHCVPYEQWFDPSAKANADWEFTIRLVQHTKVYEDVEPVVFSHISSDSISLDPRKRIRGLLRIYKKNRKLYEKNNRENSRMLFKIGSILYKLGKKRMGYKLLKNSIALNPKNSLRIFGFVRKKLLPMRQSQ